MAAWFSRSAATYFKLTAATVSNRLGRQELSAVRSLQFHSDSLALSQVNDRFRSNKRKISVGVFGAGRVSTRVHLPNILKNRRLDLKWIVEDNAERSEAAKNDLYLQNVDFFSSKDVNKLLGDTNLDAVFVFSPTGTHTEYACASLQRGKAVLVEKPAGESITDIKTCYEYSEKYGKPLLTGFNRRFDPAMNDTVNAVHNNCVGKIHIVKLTSRDSPRPSYEFLKSADKTGCNILSDFAVHDIDMLVWLTQAQRPESIYLMTHAHDSVMAEFGEADSMTALLKYQSGILATIDAVRESVYGHDIRLEVFGSDGMAATENPRCSTSVVDAFDGGKMKRMLHSFPERFNKAYENEVAHFVNCIDGLETPLVTKEESILTAEIIDKGIQSFKEGRAVKFD